MYLKLISDSEHIAGRVIDVMRHGLNLHETLHQTRVTKNYVQWYAQFLKRCLLSPVTSE